MKILIIKTTSLGDILHALPALYDAHQSIDNLRCDWLIEDQYSYILQQHPFIHKTISCHWRKFKGHALRYLRSSDWQSLKEQLDAQPYDAIIDLQGLIKSALLLRLCKSKHSHGYSWSSCREPMASLLYNNRHQISRKQHAITRSRQLMAHALGYSCPTAAPHYSLRQNKINNQQGPIIFFVGTTWHSKYWPSQHWITLGQLLQQAGYTVHIAWGTAQEKQFSLQLANRIPDATLLPDVDVIGMQNILENASGFVGVDTGFSHLATALDVPGVCIMGATDPSQSGPLGEKQIGLSAKFPCSPCQKRLCHHPDQSDSQSPCMLALQPRTVKDALLNVINTKLGLSQPLADANTMAQQPFD